VHVYGSQRKDWYPRYHLAHCTTLQEMTAGGRFERYVIAAETGGEFTLNMITGAKRRSERRHLPVCQNCLAALVFDGFSLQKDRSARKKIVQAFAPAQFFAVYPRSLHVRKPRFTSATAPLDDYPEDFPEISRRVRERAGWRCEECRRVIGAHRAQYLHVHHKNGNRRDNSPGNLKALCIVCHAEEPRHAHLKNDPRYAAFLREFVKF
jgi:hypothetical protein